MRIDDILLNDKLNKKLSDSIGKTFYKYKIGMLMDKEDFEQEVYLFIIPRLKNFDECKASLNTYIPLLVMTAAKKCFERINRDKRKFDIKNTTLSLDDSYNETACDLYDCIPDDLDMENDTFNSIMIDEILSMPNITDFQKLIIKLVAKGFTYEEVSQILNCSRSNISVNFYRAKEKIVRKYGI